ncbi:hypothetical protein BH10PSE2_BH10PSE2_12290 [soil metagenome]
MGFIRRISVAAVAIAGLAVVGSTLAGCDSGASAVQTRDRTQALADTTAPSTSGIPSGDARSTEQASVQTAVTANRSETADAKTTRLFERNGAAFGARSPEDYIAKVQAFTTNPPAGVDTVKRPNGDTLYYQASTNTFAVVSRDGTPRTMFKPDDGPTYWAQQKQRAPTFGQRRTAGGSGGASN